MLSGPPQRALCARKEAGYNTTGTPWGEALKALCLNSPMPLLLSTLGISGQGFLSGAAYFSGHGFTRFNFGVPALWTDGEGNTHVGRKREPGRDAA
jgi:hypothetical protein